MQAGPRVNLGTAVQHQHRCIPSTPPTVADSIASPRLRLLPMTPSLLRAVAAGDLAVVERQLSARVRTGWEEGIPAKLRLEQLAVDASEQPWLVRAMVASTPRRVVGSV